MPESTESVSRCRCGRTIEDGDTGWYHQAPIVHDMGDGTRLTFMDRITACDDGEPHAPAAVVVEGVKT